MPRSGSTLLLNLLAQNPRHFASATNDLCDMVMDARNSWMHKLAFKSQGLEQVRPRIRNMLAGMIRGFYAAELDNGKLVFDKSRGWLAAQTIRLMEEVWQQPVKIICNVRDVRGILGSFEQLHQKSAMTKHGVNGHAYYDMQTADGRARQYLTKGAVVGLTINRLRDVCQSGLADRLHLVTYRKLTNDPLGVLADIHTWLNLPFFKYDVHNVKQLTHEDDSVHGLELHSIKEGPVLPCADAESNWHLPTYTADWLAKEYADINHYASF